MRIGCLQSDVTFDSRRQVSELVSELENRGGLTGDDRQATEIVKTAIASPLHSGVSPVSAAAPQLTPS